jgi:Gpi18-like mannosyltransferase
VTSNPLEKLASSVAIARARRPRAWPGYVALILAVLVIKAAVIGCGAWSGRACPIDRGSYERNYHHREIIGRYQSPPHFDFFELWVVSDAQWYTAIAEHGYPSRDEFPKGGKRPLPKRIATTDTQLKYVFFPLWPLTIRATQLLVPDVNAAGFVAANVLSLVAMALLYGFLARRAGRQVAFWSVVLMAASPFAMFFDVPFTESLFLLLVVLTFMACERRRWILTGVCIGLAAVTRPNGIALLLVPPTYFVARAIRQRRWSWKEAAKLLWLAVAAIPPGLYILLNAVKTGNPFYFCEATGWWGYDQGTLWENLVNNTYHALLRFDQLAWHQFHSSQLDIIVLVIWVSLLVIGLRLVPLHYSIYAAAVILVPLLTKDLMSFSRYAVVAWPVFYVIAVALRDKARRWVCGVLSLILLIGQFGNIAAFVNWYWVG